MNVVEKKMNVVAPLAYNIIVLYVILKVRAS